MSNIDKFTVYKHTCPNGKVYIGITKQDPKIRWRNNGQGYRKNKHFYSAIQKYDWDNIEHKILYSSLSKEEACKREIELIALYKSNQREYGYNVSNGGEVNCGFTISKERKKQISETLKKRYQEQGHPLKGKSKSDKQKERLRQSLLGKKLSEKTKEKISKANKGKTKSIAFKKAVTEREQSKVSNILQIDFGGNIINIFNSIQEASRKTNIAATKICAVCKGKRHYAKGFIWLYEKDINFINDRLKQIKR